MSRARTRFQIIGAVALTSLLAAGCGGGDDAATAVPDGAATPTPATTDGATVVGGPAPAAGATDPTTGLPVDPAAGDATSGTTATVPDLSGEDLSGGLAAVNGAALFAPGAVPVDALPSVTEKEVAEVPQADPTPTEPAATFAGAKIYVDGIVHDVSINGVFPKGNPVFRLVSVGAGTIELELVAGEFTSGGGVGTLLDKGELVSLVNGSEQLTYRVKYLRPVVDTGAISF